jgi:hypothetical protein
MLALVRTLESFLHLLTAPFVRLQALKGVVEGLVKPALVKTAEDHCLESDGVWRDALEPHLSEQLLCLADVGSLDARLYQAGVDNQTWLDLLPLHLVKNTESVR